MGNQSTAFVRLEHFPNYFPFANVLYFILLCQVDDGPSMAVAQRNIDHFDHAFKGELHSSQGPYFSNAFGECKFAKRSINVVCKSGGMDLIEDVGLSARSQMELKYIHVAFLF
jgi:hypothetical protein